MKTFVPHYYSDFKCVAGECKHSCCIGWEIDVDSATLQKYKSVKTDFGKKIFESIETQNGCSYFKLCRDESCPFLNSQNLCDIILNLGEDYICDICRDHPRFRHFYSECTEIGLGICCEEVCRIILSDDKPFSFVSICGEGQFFSEELAFLHERDTLFKIIEQSTDVFNAMASVNSIYGLKTSESEDGYIADFYLSLEMLDDSWKDMLLLLKFPKTCHADKNSEKYFLNLYKYFIFRHLSDETFYKALAFSDISVKIVYAICERTGFSFENICEIARMYSAEIEYSDENFDKVAEFAED